jgi:uncharacterized protein DUF397
VAIMDSKWRKSTRSSESANCVEVRLYNGQVEVRDTKLGNTSPVLGFQTSGWSGFVTAVKDGEFDLKEQ